MTKEEQKNIFNLVCIYVLLQPFFDILSNLYLDGIIKFGISTYIKPLFVLLLSVYMFLKFTKKKTNWIIYGLIFILFMLGHFYILKMLYIPNSIILHEFRFLINIIYMILLLLIFFTLFSFYSDKNEFLLKLKKTIFLTFLIYSILFIISIITKTSGMTYEYADALKKGFKGWYDSGQILGHAIAIMLPSLIYIILKPRNKWFIRIIFTLPLFATICMLGTKVPFFILIIVLMLYVLGSFFNLIFVKYYKFNIFNILYCIICLSLLLVTYRYLPVAYNIKLNNSVYKMDLDSYELDSISGKNNNLFVRQIMENNKEKNLHDLEIYNIAVEKASKDLYSMYSSGKIHPSENRKSELYYSYKKFNYLPVKYKIFGVGFLNQEANLSLESDFLMALFSFGILGFACIMFLPLIEFIKSTLYILKNITSTDLETYLLYAGFGIFFCISIFAGYTYIYTNFSIYLVILIFMIKSKIYINKNYKKENKKIKKITFLLLHLGYGGIESATINSANALSKKYNVELVSLYNISNSQINNINNNVKVKFLYNGGPNKQDFLDAVKIKNVFKIFTEGIKSAKILFLKKYLIIREIRKSNSDAIISTRMEFSILLSKYGKVEQLRIAQEHRHHNDEKGYIRNIKKYYGNLDYLFALTNSLKKDYENYLKDDCNIKIVEVPNMIKTQENCISNLKNKNVISVGRLHPGKKVDELVDIYSKVCIKNSKLYIIGDGTDFSKISQKILDLGLDKKAIMLGYMNHGDIKKYMLDSCLFLMTSESEGLPMVLLEAMSCGLPCIAFETASGTKDIIKNGKNGFLIKNRNKDKYLDKINLLLNDKKLLRRMSIEAIKTSKNYCEDSIVKIWTSILK